MHTREKGQMGETIACRFLVNNGFIIIERNYQKKWGEIDIIARKDYFQHFFEVKSVAVSRFMEVSGTHRPEENVHPFKVRHIRRMIETYQSEKGGGLGREFSFHVLCVYMNLESRKARIKWIPDIIL